MVTQLSQYAAVQDLFDQTAAQFAGLTAIDNGVRRVTYGELQTDAQRLSHLLAQRGAAENSIVAIFLTDPIGVVSSILATLKTGSVFCALDPSFPPKRLEAMFERTTPKWCITHSRFQERLQRVFSTLESAPEIILIDNLPATNGFTPAIIPANPNAPCSIYFTSGSTGKPKAILGRLNGIDHFIRWEIETVGARPGTRVSQLASPSFDGFLKDAFVPLCSGGLVCAPESREILLDAGRLIDWIDVEQIEVLHLVPSVFRSVINHGLNDRYFEALQYVVLAGEHLYPADVKRWMEVFGERIKLLNTYGATETTILKSWHCVEPADAAKSSVPIGKPIRGAAMMVIDQQGQPCSVGDIGEIYVRTPYRSHGYYGEPELTKQVFIQNPFNSDPADVIYKTGDYGRLLPDGNFEILGRRDAQVKIRGVRIELGEIENLLRANTSVGEVAVIDREDGAGNKILVAYVTMTNGAGPESLRAYLLDHLP
ncbi:MAG TPA: amino acid adenylation domain-containing protein, partial [Pyrinomonadaceae bacterium]|nr:amino acid adenylation domain-containing protein [Pyrinomonadaceae bacterium]